MLPSVQNQRWFLCSVHVRVVPRWFRSCLFWKNNTDGTTVQDKRNTILDQLKVYEQQQLEEANSQRAKAKTVQAKIEAAEKTEGHSDVRSFTYGLNYHHNQDEMQEWEYYIKVVLNEKVNDVTQSNELGVYLHTDTLEETVLVDGELSALAAFLLQTNINQVNVLLFLSQGFLKLSDTFFQLTDLSQSFVSLTSGSRTLSICPSAPSWPFNYPHHLQP